jgi:hypothetical protein
MQHADFVSMRVRTLSRSAASADCVLEGAAGTKGFSFDVIAPGTAETSPAGGGWTCGRWVGVGARARACYSARVATVASCLVKTQTTQAATSWWMRVILADDIAEEAGDAGDGERVRGQSYQDKHQNSRQGWRKIAPQGAGERNGAR